MAYQGYVSSRDINENFIPQRIQNLALRNYAEQNNLLLNLSGTEYSIDNCFMILKSILNTVSSLDGVIFYSIWQLESSSEMFKRIESCILDDHSRFHFVLENMVVTTVEDLRGIKDLCSVNRISKLVDVSKIIFEID